jgi:pyruvate dehydrogenase E1 component
VAQIRGEHLHVCTAQPASCTGSGRHRKRRRSTSPPMPRQTTECTRSASITGSGGRPARPSSAATSSTSRAIPRPGIYARALCSNRLTEEQLDFSTARKSPARARACLLSASVADAGFLAVPDRVDGARPDAGHLPGRFMKYLSIAASPIPATARSGASSATARWTSRNRWAPSRCRCARSSTTWMFVINCNLQRLDGPVRGNGKIIQELEGAFRGAGWNVIKVLWGSRWDPLLAEGSSGLLRRRMEVPSTANTRISRRRRCLHARALLRQVSRAQGDGRQLSDEDIWRLNRGGHDPRSRCTPPMTRP